ncbi:Tef4p [Rhizophagus irregularis DAOM 197198w]|uniref:Tef4p n=1 Tax=Rhizophagus irregularis (strain DAOM 197198w) TaxID=1432141 RepID=A0A015JBN9_RHIIW|nr:Tef4p [Rhizophagus irregularis DAOM 197198w]
MSPIGKIYCYPNNPRVFKILIAAHYNELEVEIAEFEIGKDNKKPEHLEKFHNEKLVLDAGYRKGHPNLTRWYTTLINQPSFKKVLGDITLADVAVEYTPPKKEKKEQPKKEKEAKPKAVDVVDVDEEEEKPAPKPKSKLDSLPPSSLNLEEWKRVYSNNDTRPTAINWFWENFDPEGYSIWRVDYKYNDELTKVFMSSNLIGGFFNRLERARKYAFGSLVVLGEDNANSIAGYFVIRGQEVPEEVYDAADFESYTFNKVDHTDPSVKSSFEDYIAWDGHLDGKKYADGKIFK